MEILVQLNRQTTKVYSSPIFGPVRSRRLGVSLGVNLMPGDGKVCTFDCLYCECGYNKDHITQSRRPTREEVRTALSAVLRQRLDRGEPLDCITFSGNGEPTAHPDFAGIISDTIQIRDELFHDAKVSVLSNATFVGKKDVRQALMAVDNNILKLDTVSGTYIDKVDRPQQHGYNVREVIRNLKLFDGHLVIQTMFMRGTSDGESVDNTGDEYVVPWLEALKEIAPRQVMIYTIDRATPEHGLRKAEPEVLDAIKARVERLGIKCTASY